MRRNRITATARQPILTFAARQKARARELAAAMQSNCCACGSALAAHIAAGNRWKGCPAVSVQGGAR